jgi:hypothetical protein
MKKLLLIAPVILTVIAARADVVIVQKMESAMMNGEMTMKIKGDKGRVDMPTGPVGAMSMIIDGATGDVSTVMHGQKMIMKANRAQLKEATDKAKEIAGGTAAAQEKPKATGKTEKVGEWTAEIYEGTASGQATKLWVVKDFPNGEKVKAEMMKITKAMGQGIDAASMDVPGMPVKTEITSALGKITITTIKAVEQAVDAKEFEIPKDYQEMSIPSLPGAPK